MTTVVGVDVQSIGEVAQSLAEFGSRYTRRLFTDAERSHCNESPETAASRYAERFAAKEAVLKVLSVRSAVPSWKDIEIRLTGSGRFEVALHGVAAELAHERGIRALALSMSHAGGIATAVVVAR